MSDGRRGARKIQDLGEIQRWYEQGMTYPEMSDLYVAKYNIEVTPSMFANIRWRYGWERRNVSSEGGLIPWDVSQEHMTQYPAQMLRAEMRRREGKPLSQQADRKLRSWHRRMDEMGVVVHYDDVIGFCYIPRGEQDEDLIREPQQES